MTQQKVKIKIPKAYKPAERKAIAREVVDFIIERSKAGKDKNNKAFPAYSDSYAQSEAFKDFGKSKAKVNVTLTGEMIESLDRLSDSNGEIIIGYEKGDDELNGKVEGNITGSYGGKKARKEKARDFMGISSGDLKRILEKYPVKNKQDRELRVEAIEIATKKGVSLTEAIRLAEEEFDYEI